MPELDFILTGARAAPPARRPPGCSAAAGDSVLMDATATDFDSPVLARLRADG